MEGTPQSLTDVKFTQLRRGGYDPEEVDNYLERVSGAVAQLQDKLRNSTDRAEIAEAKLAEARRAESDAVARLERAGDMGSATREVSADEELTRVLVLAQRAADQALEEANNEAAKTLSDARGKAINLVAEAEQERDRLMAKARKNADKLAEERVRVLSEQVDALAAARVDLEADVDALRVHLDAERARMREGIDSIRDALDHPESLRLSDPPVTHDTPIPVIELPGDEDLDEPVRAEIADPLASGIDTGSEPDRPRAVLSSLDLTDGAAEIDEIDVDEIDVDEVDVVDTASVAPIIEPVAEPAVERAAEPSPMTPRPTFTDDRADHRDLTGRVEPSPAPAGADEGVRRLGTDRPAEPADPSDSRLFPVSGIDEDDESDPGPKTELFTPDLEESPLGEPDEEADAAMRAFFERDLDDPGAVPGRGRFGRRR